MTGRLSVQEGKERGMNVKRTLAGLLTVLGFGSGLLNAKDLKVLMIGNSFSDCVGKYLPQIVKSSGHKLELTSAYVSGCSLEQHSKNFAAAEKDPSFSPYRITVWNSEEPDKPLVRKGNVNELLTRERYDVITVQQGGSRAPFRETFHPYLEHLIGCVRQKQPDAEIVFQQTWSYRIDDTRFKPHPNPKFDFDQTGMYERVRDAYLELASVYKMRVIPTGTAIQCYRKAVPVKFDPAAQPKVFPEVNPTWKGDPVGCSYWKENKETGKQELRTDLIHLNRFGEYLQACVWFSFLYGDPAEKITFVPVKISEAECALLRKCAREALDQYPQARE